MNTATMQVPVFSRSHEEIVSMWDRDARFSASPKSYEAEIDIQLLEAVITEAVNAFRYRYPLKRFQVVVGADVVRQCLRREVDISELQHSCQVAGNAVQLLGWAEGITIVPLLSTECT